MFAKLFGRDGASWVGKWALCLWSPEQGESQVAGEDLPRLRESPPGARVFHCTGWDGGYVVLEGDDRRFRVRPGPLKAVPAPAFVYGQGVILDRDPPRRGVVAEIHWHSKEGREFYKIREGAHLNSRRYWAEELRADPEAG